MIIILHLQSLTLRAEETYRKGYFIPEKEKSAAFVDSCIHSASSSRISLMNLIAYATFNILPGFSEMDWLMLYASYILFYMVVRVSESYSDKEEDSELKSVNKQNFSQSSSLVKENEDEVRTDVEPAEKERLPSVNSTTPAVKESTEKNAPSFQEKSLPSRKCCCNEFQYSLLILEPLVVTNLVWFISYYLAITNMLNTFITECYLIEKKNYNSTSD